MLTALKWTLAPALVAAASLVERRFGHRAAGWTAGFPIVAGPILFLLAWEQGATFAATAAKQTLLGLVSLAAFAVTYGRASRDASPALSLACAYAAFATATLAMSRVSVPLAVALMVAFACLTLARALLPAVPPPTAPATPPSLVLRMAATAGIVFAVTGLAHAVGPRWSGLLVPFPIASTVLVVAAHRSAGRSAAIRVLEGLVPGLYGFALFCAAVAQWLPEHGNAIAFGTGIAASALAQAVVLRIR